MPIADRTDALLPAVLIGLVAGQRALTPLAAIATAARTDALAPDAFAGTLLRDPVVAAGAATLAALEMAGDKMKSAPDRTSPAGLIARSMTSAFAGAVLAPRGQRGQAAVIATWTALASSYAGLALRKAAMRRVGQTASGVVEDAAVMASALAIAGTAKPAGR